MNILEINIKNINRLNINLNKEKEKSLNEKNNININSYFPSSIKAFSIKAIYPFFLFLFLLKYVIQILEEIHNQNHYQKQKSTLQ